MPLNGAPSCRFCGSPLTQSLVDLGVMPLANSYLAADQLSAAEPRFPLHARVCGACRLVQVDAVASPAELFGHYAYFSSYATSWLEHSRRFAEMAIARWHLDDKSMVVEVASNDGYLLRAFLRAGVPVLGVEPAANVAEAARAIGVPSDVSFFGLATARRLKESGHAADLLVGNNVLAHVPDINDFVAGLAHLVKPEGVISLEFPHLLKLIEETQFDTIYHEHFSYLSLLTVERVLARHGLRVFAVEELETHGGSLRVMACHRTSATHAEEASVAKLRRDEAAARLDQDRGYAGFAPRVDEIRERLLSFLSRARDDGKTVAAYGAAAKGNTLLNYCGIDGGLVRYVADRSPHKQGLYLPGSHLPIVPPEKLIEARPDYILILPWNLKEEITAQLAPVRALGAQCFVAVPRLAAVP